MKTLVLMWVLMFISTTPGTNKQERVDLGRPMSSKELCEATRIEIMKTFTLHGDDKLECRQIYVEGRVIE